ncbi:hypothetical protein DPMN_013970 [Dreissena polymorpha]|uniref:Uncharacterized protein n=1 Tax=Dreissena polymorpha TaxID=45954 RepID=A0A9D4S486_DREPO|nr:hypothetical protein DPMN_013970 [Dreissena polymorpha]
MIRALHLLALVALIAYVSAFCTSNADCPASDCGHGEMNTCVLVSGGGVGFGEKQCQCVRHKRAAPCQTTSDCSHLSCPIGQSHACVQHGGHGEKSCVCQ